MQDLRLAATQVYKDLQLQQLLVIERATHLLVQRSPAGNNSFWVPTKKTQTGRQFWIWITGYNEKKTVVICEARKELTEQTESEIQVARSFPNR